MKNTEKSVVKLARRRISKGIIRKIIYKVINGKKPSLSTQFGINFAAHENKSCRC